MLLRGSGKNLLLRNRSYNLKYEIYVHTSCQSDTMASCWRLAKINSLFLIDFQSGFRPDRIQERYRVCYKIIVPCMWAAVKELLRQFPLFHTDVQHTGCNLT